MFLCLQVGDRELLADAHLRLYAGTRYGLLGRWGSAARQAGSSGRCCWDACPLAHMLGYPSQRRHAWSGRPRRLTPARPLPARNGVGKSTLLKAIGWGLVIGFPKNLRCL